MILTILIVKLCWPLDFMLSFIANIPIVGDLQSSFARIVLKRMRRWSVKIEVRFFIIA